MSASVVPFSHTTRVDGNAAQPERVSSGSSTGPAGNGPDGWQAGPAGEAAPSTEAGGDGGRVAGGVNPRASLAGAVASRARETRAPLRAGVAVRRLPHDSDVPRRARAAAPPPERAGRPSVDAEALDNPTFTFTSAPDASTPPPPPIG
jgi:hypothetical protein